MNMGLSSWQAPLKPEMKSRSSWSIFSMDRAFIMCEPPTDTTWKITCHSPGEAEALQQWLASRIGLDLVWTDTIRATPNGVEQVQTVRHRLGDYFADIRMMPDSQGPSSSFRLFFHGRPDARHFWKDLMVNILQEIENGPQKSSIELNAKPTAPTSMKLPSGVRSAE
jgi:hypothetical protein